MNRRAFVTGSIALLTPPLAAAAQQAAKIPRIGFLSASSLAEPRIQRYIQAFRQGLRELSYVEGRDIAIELRSADGKYDRLPGLAAEFVRLKVDVIVTYGAPASHAAKEATRTVPVVVAVINDLVAAGFVASLARPRGNITGLSMMAPELVGKQLQILRELVPEVSRVAILSNPATGASALQVQQAHEAARALGVRLQPLEASRPIEIESAFVAMTTEKAGAVIVLQDSMLLDNRTQIADLAARRRLPTVSVLIDHAEAGGLIAYGPSVSDMFRRAAIYVDKILKGAKPGDLPIEQPTKFDLVINLKTAKALGLTIPPSLLLRADQVIDP